MPFLARNYFIRVNHHPIYHWSCLAEMRRINHLIASENVRHVWLQIVRLRRRMQNICNYIHAYLPCETTNGIIHLEPTNMNINWNGGRRKSAAKSLRIVHLPTFTTQSNRWVRARHCVSMELIQHHDSHSLECISMRCVRAWHDDVHYCQSRWFRANTYVAPRN